MKNRQLRRSKLQLKGLYRRALAGSAPAQRELILEALLEGTPAAMRRLAPKVGSRPEVPKPKLPETSGAVGGTYPTCTLCGAGLRVGMMLCPAHEVERRAMLHARRILSLAAKLRVARRQLVKATPRPVAELPPDLKPRAAAARRAITAGERVDTAVDNAIVV